MKKIILIAIVAFALSSCSSTGVIGGGCGGYQWSAANNCPAYRQNGCKWVRIPLYLQIK